MQKAFTLIELLVVVLIIGILSAVALPQYQLAVKKTHLMKSIPTLKSISYAKYLYYLENGHYTNDLDALSVNLPYTSGAEGTYSGTPLGGTVLLSSTGDAVIWYAPDGFKLEVYNTGVFCLGNDKLCQAAGGHFYYSTEGGTKVYELKF